MTILTSSLHLDVLNPLWHFSVKIVHQTHREQREACVGRHIINLPYVPQILVMWTLFLFSLFKGLGPSRRFSCGSVLTSFVLFFVFQSSCLFFLFFLSLIFYKLHENSKTIFGISKNAHFLEKILKIVHSYFRNCSEFQILFQIFKDVHNFRKKIPI